jgi:hypothetical protein
MRAVAETRGAAPRTNPGDEPVFLAEFACSLDSPSGTGRRQAGEGAGVLGTRDSHLVPLCFASGCFAKVTVKLKYTLMIVCYTYFYDYKQIAQTR